MDDIMLKGKYINNDNNTDICNLSRQGYCDGCTVLYITAFFFIEIWVIPCEMSKFSEKWLLKVLQTSGKKIMLKGVSEHYTPNFSFLS